VLLIIYYLLSTWRLDLNFKNIKKIICLFLMPRIMNFYVFPVLKETNTKIYFGSLTTNQQLEKIQ
jgi:hypothetical protein